MWLGQTLGKATQFGVGGYLVLLLGQKVGYRNPHRLTEQELQRWNAERQQYRSVASRGLTVKEALAKIRSPHWEWKS
jgi:tryptophan halogenase